MEMEVVKQDDDDIVEVDQEKLISDTEAEAGCTSASTTTATENCIIKCDFKTLKSKLKQRLSLLNTADNPTVLKKKEVVKPEEVLEVQQEKHISDPEAGCTSVFTTTPTEDCLIKCDFKTLKSKLKQRLLVLNTADNSTLCEKMEVVKPEEVVEIKQKKLVIKVEYPKARCTSVLTTTPTTKTSKSKLKKKRQLLNTTLCEKMEVVKSEEVIEIKDETLVIEDESNEARSTEDCNIKPLDVKLLLNDPDNSMLCEKCGYKTEDVSHMKKHRGEQCSFKFLTKSGLKHHSINNRLEENRINKINSQLVGSGNAWNEDTRDSKPIMSHLEIVPNESVVFNSIDFLIEEEPNDSNML